jgi:hypothetical protein
MIDLQADPGATADARHDERQADQPDLTGQATMQATSPRRTTRKEEAGGTSLP